MKKNETEYIFPDFFMFWGKKNALYHKNAVF